MIRMMQVLVAQYGDRQKLYLSWDAASWHLSKKLFERLDEHNFIVGSKGPTVETAPLPARAQFLNVIEAIFSGMSRAVIQNSDYQSVDDAKAAIDRYFNERNAHFRDHPRRAGGKVWGKEPEPARFSEFNNCTMDQRGVQAKKRADRSEIPRERVRYIVREHILLNATPYVK